LKPWYSTLFTNCVIFGSSLAGSILTARYLGAENRGLLAAIIYWPHFIAGVAALGLNEGIVIQTAKSGSTNTLRATTLALSIVLSFVVGITSFFLLPLLLGEGRQDYLRFSQFYLLLFLPCTYLAQNFLAIDQGELSFRSFNIQRVLQSIAYPLLLLILWSTGSLTVKSAAIAVLSGTAIVALLRIWNARLSLFKRPSRQEAKQLLIVSIRLHLANIVMFLSEQVDKMVLVLFASNTELGLYVVATTAAGAVVALFIQTYINIMLPTAAKFGTKMESIHEIIFPLRLLVVIIVLSTVFLAFLMPYLIGLVFGIEFAAAAPYAQILLLAFAFAGMKKAFVYLLRSWKENRSAIFGEGLTAFILIAGANYTILKWGTTGICVLVVLAQIAGAVLVGYRFFNKTGLTLKQIAGLEPNGKR